MPPARTEITEIVPMADLVEINKLDQAARAAHRQLVEASQAGNEMAKGLIMNRAIQTLRGLLTRAIMTDIMGLMNSPLGFKTDRPNDRNPKPYSEEEVRDVMVQALIKGVRPTANEMNIIAGGLYITKEGYERLVNELPGVRNLRIEVGVPKILGDKGAIVECKASWKFHGQADTLVCEGPYAIPIKVNAAMGTDAIQGKATSKMLRRIYKILTNMDIGPDEDEDTAGDPTTIEGTARTLPQPAA